jgi:hypothetical protein
MKTLKINIRVLHLPNQKGARLSKSTSNIIQHHLSKMLNTGPRERRHPRCGNIPPQSVLLRFHTDLPRFRSELRTLRPRSHRDDTFFQTLRRPIRGRGATAPEPDTGLLGQLRVVEQVDPHWEDDLGDAGAAGSINKLISFPRLA